MRPIDADAIPYTMLYKEDWIKGTGQEKQGAWKEDIDKIPTLEPKPKRGRWIKKEERVWYWYECSECGEEPLFRHGGRIFSNYCPNCGAEMESE